MIKKMFIGSVFFLFTIHAERTLYLDQERVQEAVAEIMMNRGIVLVDEVEAEGLRLQASALGGDQVSTRNHFTHEFLAAKEYSVNRLYSLGFLYLWAGQTERACAVWRHIALCYPLHECEQQLVGFTQDLLAQVESGNRFLALRVLAHDEQSDIEMPILLPIGSSTILSAFLIG